MFFKKKKSTLDYDYLRNEGYPPIFSMLIVARIELLKRRNPALKGFRSDDFSTLPIWPTDKEKLVKTLNKALQCD